LKKTAILLTLCFALSALITGCGRKNEITPLVEKRSLIEQLSDDNTVELTLRFPLTESSIDAYEDVTAVDTPVLGGLFSSFNKMFYKLGTTFGLGKMRFRIHQVLPDIDPQYIKEMKITKVFFTVDDSICDTPDIDYDEHPLCKKKKNNWFKTLLNIKKEDTNFNFVKSVVLQMFPSNVIPAEDTVVSEPAMVYRGFKDMMTKTFPTLFDPEIRRRSQNSKDEENGQKKTKKELRKDKRAQNKQDRKDKREVRKQKKADKKDAKDYEDVDLEDNYDDVLFGRNKVDPIDVGRYFRNEKGVLIGQEYEDMLLIKTNDSFYLKKYINKTPTYKKYVKTMTSIQGMLFLQLKDKTVNLKIFMEDLLYDIEGHSNNIKIDSVKSCLEGDCIALEVPDVNLIDHLAGKNSVIIDTYLHVKDVPSKTFQLKGFVEFKVKVKLDY
jgi:hypothetical protein